MKPLNQASLQAIHEVIVRNNDVMTLLEKRGVSAADVAEVFRLAAAAMPSKTSLKPNLFYRVCTGDGSSQIVGYCTNLTRERVNFKTRQKLHLMETPKDQWQAETKQLDKVY